MRHGIIAAAFVIAGLGTAQAQDAETISLELNRATASAEGGCQVIFYGKNGLSQDFEDVTWRLAVFDSEGVFRNLLSLPLGALSAGKRRVVQYNLPSPCAELGEIIVNDVSQCVLAGGSEADSDACLEKLTVSSRTELAFGL